MNEDIQQHPRPIGEAELRLALRGLRQDAVPGNDLWPGIAGRIAALPQQTRTAPSPPRQHWLWPGIAGRIAALPQQMRTAPSPPRQHWLWPLATAASLLLVVGVARQLPSPALAPAMSGTPIVTAAGVQREAVVQREAETLTVQYQAALSELDVPPLVPTGWQAGLDALDGSAEQIRAALQRDPNSRLLLQRLRDTYTRRLALSRRALYV